MALAFFGDKGVEFDDQERVTSWTDLVSSTTLEPTADPPTRVSNGRSGHDLIRFEDSATILLTRDGVDLPVGNEDRTTIVAGNWTDTLMGLGWGDPITDDTSFFTGSVNFNCFSQGHPGIATGLRSFGTYCGGHTTDEFLIEDIELLQAEFVTTGARLRGGTLDLLFRDEVRESSDVTLGTVSSQLWLGAWPQIDEVSSFDLVVAVVYDRALSDEELTEVDDFLKVEYGIDS